MEFKGFISINGRKSITCCESVADIYIGGDSLYNAIESVAGDPDSEAAFNGETTQGNSVTVSYVILDSSPTNWEDITFEELAAYVQTAKFTGNLFPEYCSGCYSEWTCGFGGWKYYCSGHNVFDELSSHDGKWVYIKLS